MRRIDWLIVSKLVWWRLMVVLVMSSKGYPGVSCIGDRERATVPVSRNVSSCETRRWCKGEWMLRRMVKYNTFQSVVSGKAWRAFLPRPHHSPCDLRASDGPSIQRLSDGYGAYAAVGLVAI